jgi:Tol biopolymer transport system component/DNA-binding winged helix-turn-helix (wHTH) protein
MVTPASTRPVWRFGVFEVDTRRVELRRNGIPVKLREQSFQILVYLLEHAGEIVTREELRRLLWPSDTFVDFDHSLNTAVMKLREALGDSIETPIYIETVPKRGYRFIAPIASGNDRPTHSVIAEARLEADRKGASGLHRRSHRRLRLLIAACAAVVFAVIAGFVFWRARHLLPGSRGQARTARSYRIDSITTARGSFKDPAVSPDGRDVAYAWNGGGGDHWDIYVQRIGLPKPMRITYVESGFVGNPAWSPDQTEIAFTRCDGENDGVYIVPAFGGQEPERKLTSTSCQYHFPSPVVWLRDSRMLMIDRCPASGLHALVLFSMQTGEKRCIADFGPSGVNRRFKFSVSPDEKTVAFMPSWESPVCEVYVMPVTGGAPRRVVEDRSSCDDLMWAPDGKQIVILSERTKFLSVWQVAASGGELRESGYPAIGSFSRDGRRFAYEESANGEPHAVWRADLESPGGRVIGNWKVISTQYPELDAQPSPDGVSIVWAERRAGVEELWIGSSTGRNPRQLTFLNTYSGTARWSPDCNWIVFDSGTANGNQIFVMDVEGRNRRQITEGPYQNVVPSWSRDGKSIYFASNRTGNKEVWKHSLETGKETQLTVHGGFNPFESFDGQTVYFSKWDEAGIWSVPSSGGAESLVLRGRPQVLYWGFWALTKPGIYFLNSDAKPRAQVEFYDFATRRIWAVLSIEKNVPYGQPSLSASADGKTVFYSQLDRQSVIKVMDAAD